MTLKRKFLLRSLVPVGGLVLTGAAALVGLLSLRGDVHDAMAGSRELRRAEALADKLEGLRTTLLAPSATPEAAGQAALTLNGSLPEFDQAMHGGWTSAEDDHFTRSYDDVIRRTVTSAKSKAKQAADLLRSDPSGTKRPEAAALLAGARDDLAGVVKGCNIFIENRNYAADEKVRVTAMVMGGLFAVTLLAATASSYFQHRSVMVPLDRLREGTRKVAAAQFSERLDESAGPKEFAEVAAEFNRMAAELQGFYQKLEEQVAAKSRELVRSERLASVGFLAAGVAHEINNPLNIISGYAELTARKLKTPGPLDPVAAAEAAKCLHIIRDEAFRCKDITEKLLSLSKGGNENREVLSLADVAKEVAEMTRALKSYRDRRLRLRFPADEPLCVVAQRTEMKQVLLNLTVNALDAVKPREGEVCIEGRRSNGWVELKVKDNGRGIPAETLRHVFEPFFTDKRGSPAPGTGLGLSITHAIVENHGGRIRAESGGVGRGSQFTLVLPWAKKPVPQAGSTDASRANEPAAAAAGGKAGTG